MTPRRALASLFLAASFLLNLACGGGSSETRRPVIQPLTISTATLPNAIRDQAYSTTLAATGGSGTRSWSTTAGSLPAGLTLSATGVISGTPTATGTFTFTVQVQDTSGSASKELSLQVNPPPLSISTSALATVIVGVPYSDTLQATGGTPAYTWALAPTSNPLPAGLTLASDTGVLSGTAGASAKVTVTFRVTDSTAVTADKALLVDVAGVLNITTTSLPNATQGAPYTQTLQVTGGTGTLTWTLLAGSTLPSGYSLSSAGLLSGNTTATGAFNFTVRVADSGIPTPQTDTQALSLTINPGPVTVFTTSVPNASIGVAYSTTLVATGGQPPYSWALAPGSGPLPTGLTLNADGTLTGTPSVIGTFNFTVRVTDALAAFHEKAFTIIVSGAGRNESTATATPLTNGTHSASISPLEAIGTVDQDFYKFTASAGAQVTIEIFAKRLTPPSALDPVIEIVDASQVRFATCKDPGDDLVTNDDFQGLVIIDPTPAVFDDPCMNDDIDLGVNRDSRLEFEVPGSGTVTFFVRVFDWSGRARPDMLYNLVVSGVD